MAKLDRVIEIDGKKVIVPQFVNRTVSGWQVRVRGVESQHFSDFYYGGALQALEASSDVVSSLLLVRADRLKR